MNKRTLVVEVQLVLVVRSRFVILEVLSQLLVVGDGSVQGLSSRKALPKLGPFLTDLGVFQQERPAVEVVPPLPILSSLPRKGLSVLPHSFSQALGCMDSRSLLQVLVTRRGSRFLGVQRSRPVQS